MQNQQSAIAEKPSRLDAKLKRDDLLHTQSKQLWDELWRAIQLICEKLNSRFKKGLNCGKIDGSNGEQTHIWVGAAIDSFTRAKPSMTLDYDPNSKQVTVGYSNNPETKVWNPLGTFRIRVHPKTDELFFQEGKTELSALQLAETLIAEKMLHINLDD